MGNQEVGRSDEQPGWRVVYSEQMSDAEEFLLHARGTLSEHSLNALDEYCDRQRERIAQSDGPGRGKRDTDGSPEGGDGEAGSVRSTTAGADEGGIAQPPSEEPC